MHQTKLSTKFEKKILFQNFSLFSPVSLTPLINFHSRISLRIFEKIRNGPIGILRGPGDTDLRKKSDVENFVSDSRGSKPSPGLLNDLYLQYPQPSSSKFSNLQTTTMVFFFKHFQPSPTVLKGAQAWDIRERFFYTNQRLMVRWLRDWRKKLKFRKLESLF